MSVILDKRSDCEEDSVLLKVVGNWICKKSISKRMFEIFELISSKNAKGHVIGV